MRLLKAIIGDIDFYNQGEPSEYAEVKKIDQIVFFPENIAEQQAEKLTTIKFQSYLIPDLYKGEIKYSLQ